METGNILFMECCQFFCQKIVKIYTKTFNTFYVTIHTENIIREEQTYAEF